MRRRTFLAGLVGLLLPWTPVSGKRWEITLDTSTPSPCGYVSGTVVPPEGHAFVGRVCAGNRVVFDRARLRKVLERS